MSLYLEWKSNWPPDNIAEIRNLEKITTRDNLEAETEENFDTKVFI